MLSLSKHLSLDVERVPGRRTVRANVDCGRLDRQHEAVTKRRRDRASRLQESFQVRLGCFLKPQDRLAPVASMRMTTWQKLRLGNPGSIFVLSHLNLGDRNNHLVDRLSDDSCAVNPDKHVGVAAADSAFCLPTPVP